MVGRISLYTMDFIHFLLILNIQQYWLANYRFSMMLLFGILFVSITSLLSNILRKSEIPTEIQSKELPPHFAHPVVPRTLSRMVLSTTENPKGKRNKKVSSIWSIFCFDCLVYNGFRSWGLKVVCLCHKKRLPRL